MKFSGVVGFLKEHEKTKPGVWKPSFEEKPYFGDVLVNNRRYVENSDKQNDDFTITNRISILSDLYAQQNWKSIRYVVWNGLKWKVSNVDLINYPRLILEIGGIYNG